ncbi:hypothetical protein [Deinococcus apachensis]|uniref:hypothetical protein n=1 Tax=Deinococcus apachensis TaxID=309886 RepID=UPI0003657068|nr:hypothetical protein [Deinococcus apachensis]
MLNNNSLTSFERSVLATIAALGGRSLHERVQHSMKQQQERRAEREKTREFERELRRWTQG